MKVKSSTCSKCSRVVVPPRDLCPYCGIAGSMEPTELSPRGEILSYTLLHMPPEGFEPPLMMALVRLEQDATVLCLLEEKTTFPDLKIGANVELSLDDAERLRFRPMK